MKKTDPIYEGLYAVETLKKGTFVKLSESAKRVWIVGDYIRAERAYCLTAFDDISADKLVKKGKKLFAGFIF